MPYGLRGLGDIGAPILVTAGGAPVSAAGSVATPAPVCGSYGQAPCRGPLQIIEGIFFPSHDAISGIAGQFGLMLTVGAWAALGLVVYSVTKKGGR